MVTPGIRCRLHRGGFCGHHAGSLHIIIRGDAVFLCLRPGDPAGQSLLAGAPAGTFAALLTIPIVWWAFMPPHFEFNPLTAADYDRFAVFLLVSALMICFSHLYREALALIRK